MGRALDMILFEIRSEDLFVEHGSHTYAEVTSFSGHPHLHVGYEESFKDRVNRYMKYDGLNEQDARDKTTTEMVGYKGYVLVGGWKRNEDGDYEPDLDKCPFSAVWYQDTGKIEVTKSMWVTRVRGGAELSFCLPPEILTEQALELTGHRVVGIYHLYEWVRFIQNKLDGGFKVSLHSVVKNADGKNLRKLYTVYPEVVKSACIYWGNMSLLE